MLKRYLFNFVVVLRYQAAKYPGNIIQIEKGRNMPDVVEVLLLWLEIFAEMAMT